jgi:heat shock protein HslJ
VQPLPLMTPTCVVEPGFSIPFSRCGQSVRKSSRQLPLHRPLANRCEECQQSFSPPQAYMAFAYYRAPMAARPRIVLLKPLMISANAAVMLALPAKRRKPSVVACILPTSFARERDIDVVTKKLIVAGPALVALLFAIPINAATPASYVKLDKASEAACTKAAGLNNTTVGATTRFSDRIPIDARIVSGTWPQAHMNGAKAQMLCLYNRKSKRVEVQEIQAGTTAVATAEIRDVWWRAENIGDRGVIDNSEVTLMLGSDGKVGGKSGCNNYSANYQITGGALKVYPPMIGTRMACPPALMTQELQYRSVLETAQSVDVTSDGILVITSVSGATSRFSRQ